MALGESLKASRKAGSLAAVLLALLVLAACSSAPPTDPPITPPPTPAFDVAHVKATWTEDCTTSHDVTDEAFCADVRLSGMTGQGTFLIVPTTIAAGDRDRAEEVCNLLAFAHFDAEAVDFGYDYVFLQDSAGDP